MTITDNTLNVSGSKQSITVSGTEILAQTITFTQPPTVTCGVSPINLSNYASASSDLVVSFQVISGPGSLSGSNLTMTGAGSLVVQASQAGDIIYDAASPVTYTEAAL